MAARPVLRRAVRNPRLEADALEDRLMRILEIVHGFPPAATGGTELYARAHALALAEAGDEVVVLAREADERRDDYEVREETGNGLRLIRINNTFRSVRSFEDTYRNQALGAVAARVIDE